VGVLKNNQFQIVVSISKIFRTGGGLINKFRLGTVPGEP